MTPIVTARLDWPSAVGNFILNFGVLEWHLLVFLEARIPPDQFVRIKKELFHRRVELAKILVCDGQHSGDQKRAFDDFFARLELVRDLRNHIAHSHLLARVVDRESEPEVVLALPKNLDAPFVPESEHLSFEELIKALTELRVLIEELERLSSD